MLYNPSQDRRRCRARKTPETRRTKVRRMVLSERRVLDVTRPVEERRRWMILQRRKTTFWREKG